MRTFYPSEDHLNSKTMQAPGAIIEQPDAAYAYGADASAPYPAQMAGHRV